MASSSLRKQNARTSDASRCEASTGIAAEGGDASSSLRKQNARTSDENLTEEELRVMVDDNELFDDCNLKDMCSVMEISRGKSCSMCNVLLNDKNSHYKNSYCKSCNQVRATEHRKVNRERINEYQRRRRKFLSSWE
jgi:hypothetical protein